MLLGHLKRVHRLSRLRLRGSSGARYAFLLAASAENLRKPAKLRPVSAIAQTSATTRSHAAAPARRVQQADRKPHRSQQPSQTKSTVSANDGPFSDPNGLTAQTVQPSCDPDRISRQIPRQIAAKTQQESQSKVAHPRRFERPAFAFGGITTSSVDYRKGHAMMRYVTVNKKEFDFLRRQAYPSVRHGFRPAAYVVLTRVFGHVTEEVHG